MEITKREVLFSTIIAAVLLTFGFVIHGKISDSLIEKYQKYDNFCRKSFYRGKL